MSSEDYLELKEILKQNVDDFTKKAAQYTTFTDEEIDEIAPFFDEKEQFAELMKAVKAATESNEKKAEALSAIRSGASIVFNIFSKLSTKGLL